MARNLIKIKQIEGLQAALESIPSGEYARQGEVALKTQVIDFTQLGTFNLLENDPRPFLPTSFEVVPTFSNGNGSIVVNFGNQGNPSAYVDGWVTRENARTIFDFPGEMVSPGGVINATIASGSSALQQEGVLICRGFFL